jgi:1,4-dihydroxy-2-naphthoate octaprenyltransferase
MAYRPSIDPPGGGVYNPGMKMQPAMWLKALRVMPRLSRTQWEGLDLLSRWLVITRAAALVMSMTSAAIGGLLALRATGHVSWWMWLLVALGLTLAHGTNNLVNDRVDFGKGVDKGNYFRTKYGPQVLETGFLTRRRHSVYILVTGLLALGIGVALGLLTDWRTWVLIGIGAFFVLFYTWPLKYIALGEISLLAVWGPLMIGGTYLVLAGEWSWWAALAGVPYALGVSATLVGKHLDKMDLDREKHITTLPVLLGDRASRVVVFVMIALMYAVLGFLVIVGRFTPIMLLPLLSLYSFFKNVGPMFRAPRPKKKPAGYPDEGWPLWFVASTFVFTRQFGGWFLLGLIVDTVLKLTVWK